MLYLCSFNSFSHQDDKILLGVSNATSGPTAQLGSKLNLGAAKYFERLNGKGGIHCQLIEMIKTDDGYEPYLTKKNTDILLKNFEIFALFNYVGTPTSHAVFNKVKKDEIDLDIFGNFLEILKQIEEGKIDQHEGSFKVGKLLKELYIDSALKKAEKLDKHKKPDAPTKKAKKISYKDFKNMQ